MCVESDSVLLGLNERMRQLMEQRDETHLSMIFDPGEYVFTHMGGKVSLAKIIYKPGTETSGPALAMGVIFNDKGVYAEYHYTGEDHKQVNVPCEGFDTSKPAVDLYRSFLDHCEVNPLPESVAMPEGLEL